MSEERRCFDIQTIDDNVVEPSETVTVVLLNPDRVTILNNQLDLSITDTPDCKCLVTELDVVYFVLYCIKTLSLHIYNCCCVVIHSQHSH